MTKKSDLISVRVSTEEKLYVKKLATNQNKSIADYVRDTLLDTTVNQSADAGRTTDSKELTAVLKQLDLKDTELSEKNKQINDLHKLLDQQQQLNLSSSRLTSDLQKKLETEQAENKSKWYQFWRD